MPQAQEETSNKDILVLLGLDEMGIWENDFTQELFGTLKAETDFSFSIHYQFLGLNTILSDEDPSELIAYLDRRASDTSYDLVMAILPAANQFLVTYGDNLYPDIPKLYILPSNASLEDIQTQTAPNAVIQSASTLAIENTINNITTILPDTEHLYVIAGSGNGDIAYTQRAEAIFESTPLDDVEVTYLIGLNKESLTEQTNQLPENSAILFLVYERDNDLNTYISVEVVEDLTITANAPIFTFFDTLIGRGTVGGNVTSSSLYAQSASVLTLELMQGNSNTHHVTSGETAYIYDWRQLQHWDIDEALLPEGSIIEFQTFTLWEEYRNSILLVIVVIIAQAISIMALFWLNVARRIALKSVHKNETEFRAIFENSIDAVAVSDKGIILMCNPAYVRLFGYDTADDLIGESVLTIIGNSEKARVGQYVEDRNHGQDVSTSYETYGQHRDGHEFAIDVHISTYTLHETFHTIAIIRDISERKKLEVLERNAEVLRIDLKKEQEIVALKERFVGIITHDFRTPLSVIQTSVHLLKAYPEKVSEEKRMNHLHKISNQANQLNEMIENMLPLVRGKDQAIKLTLLDTNIKDFCASIIDQIRVIDRDKHYFSIVDKAEQASIAIDHNLMRQILANLLTNAIKFSPAQTTIHIELDSTIDTFTIQVKDEGIGIPEEDIDDLFNPFKRAGNAGEVKGFGLGLSIVQEYVELHGASLQVESILGEGASFIITIPIA